MTQTLLIDNYDSFTYNLFQLLGEVNGAEPVVLRNDDVEGWAAVDFDRIDNLVISPGPGRPERERDFGISLLALSRRELPVLGVCLGHQGLCSSQGARIEHAPEPVHGRVSMIHHDGDGLFRGIPSPFPAVRYHSLVVAEAPPPLVLAASTDTGTVMAVRHPYYPHWGVQFHPESIETRHGRRLLANFRDLSAQARPRPARKARPAPVAGRPGPGDGAARTGGGSGAAAPLAGRQRYEVLVERLPVCPDAERAFDALAAAGPARAWLDSSSVVAGLSRYSIIGLPSRELGETVTYSVATPEVTVSAAGGRIARHRMSLFDYLERELAARGVRDPGLPCEFALGYVGYLGYELKADCGAAPAHVSELPDAALVFCDRALVVDHATGAGWLMALATPETAPTARAWLDGTRRTLERLAAGVRGCTMPEIMLPDAGSLPWRPRHRPERYLELIAACQRLIRDGESYEVCLTNMITAPFDCDPLLTYKVLRRVNPAPHAAFLDVDGLQVLSSSPERFLSIDRHGAVEAKPIKGTRGRSPDPAEDAAWAEDLRTSEKDRSENLMIVDLLRNDLGSVATVGSVEVPKLFAVETYAFVHQLVSTIRARLRAGVSPVHCVRASFPGGSMTGAPKLRTMEILDALEGGPRGVYSGALGFFSLNGAVDLSIVIRTAVLAGGQAQLGAGGAIVSMSDPDAEFEETMVKAAPILRVLAIAAVLDRLAREPGRRGCALTAAGSAVPGAGGGLGGLP